MKATRLLIIVVLLVLFAQAAFAEVDVSVTGFADVRAGYTLGDKDEFGFDFHQSRIIFNAKAADWISTVIQVGTQPGGDYGIKLGTATVNLNTVGEGAKLSLALGRFPVPIGAASGWYTSPNNAFAFDPLVTSKILGGTYSDIGALGAIKGEKYTVQAYAVQGDTPKAGAGGMIANPDKGVAGGLRAVLTPIDGFNLGLSYCLNGRDAKTATAKNNKSIIAGDISFAAGPVALIFEYLAWMPKFTLDERKDAWFAQAEFDLDKVAGIPITPGVRFDYLTSKALGGADAGNALTVQLAYKFEKYLRFGLSFRTESKAPDVITLQVLGMF